jgi:hypothetical protein
LEPPSPFLQSSLAMSLRGCDQPGCGVLVASAMAMAMAEPSLSLIAVVASLIRPRRGRGAAVTEPRAFFWTGWGGEAEPFGGNGFTRPGRGCGVAVSEPRTASWTGRRSGAEPFGGHVAGNGHGRAERVPDRSGGVSPSALATARRRVARASRGLLVAMMATTRRLLVAPPASSHPIQVGVPAHP